MAQMILMVFVGKLECQGQQRWDKAANSTSGFEGPVSVLEAQKVAGVVGCVLHVHESESI